MSQVKTVAFVGLGAMGLPMATNLAAAGLEVRGFDADKAREAVLADAGGTVGFAHPAEAGAGAAVALMSLPNSTIVEDVLLGEGGLLTLDAPPGHVIDLSTIAPGETRRLADEAAARGVRLVDAPVSGSSVGATDGTLTIMVGADPVDFETVRPLLDHLGKAVINVGPVSTGESIKLINNLLAAVNVAAVAEAHNIARKAGMDIRVLYDVVSTATGTSWALLNRMPEKGLMPGSPADNDFAPGFASELMAKDLELVRQLAQDVGSPMLLGGVVQQLYSSAMASGWGRQDFSVLAKVYRAMSESA